jgi:hypothetical protein
MQTRVFLSGAIEDVQSDFKYSWRDEATSLLGGRGFKAVNPRRLASSSGRHSSLLFSSKRHLKHSRFSKPLDGRTSS